LGRELESAARERVLVVAEELFSERGYDSVTLRDIAQALGIRQASLYHHVPGGKEQLFVEVTERSLARHRVEIVRLVAQHQGDLRALLLAVGDWLLSQPPVDIPRMVRSDMPAISEEHARRLTRAAVDSLVVPLEGAFVDARARGEVEFLRTPLWERLLAGSYLAIVDNARIGARFGQLPAGMMVECMVDVILDGLRPR
jgi:AcrR family transcriptional regulator